MGDAAAGDPRRDPTLFELAAVDVVVVAPVGEQLPRSPAWPAAPATDRRHGVDQRDQLSHVVAVAAGEGDRERNAAGVADQMVLGAGTSAVDRRGTDVVPPICGGTPGATGSFFGLVRRLVITPVRCRGQGGAPRGRTTLTAARTGASSLPRRRRSVASGQWRLPVRLGGREDDGDLGRCAGAQPYLGTRSDWCWLRRHDDRWGVPAGTRPLILLRPARWSGCAGGGPTGAGRGHRWVG